MERRESLAVLSAAATAQALPWAVRAQAPGASKPRQSARQPTSRPRIGVLSFGSAPGVPNPDPSAGLRDGLRDLGYVEGRNLVIERRFGRLEQLPELAAELVRLPVDVIVVAGPTPLRAAIAATRTIPIVMAASSSDPVGEGLLASLARPEGNLTGLTYAVSSERFGKQPELLKQAPSGIRRVAVGWDSDLDSSIDPGRHRWRRLRSSWGCRCCRRCRCSNGQVVCAFEPGVADMLRLRKQVSHKRGETGRKVLVEQQLHASTAS